MSFWKKEASGEGAPNQKEGGEEVRAKKRNEENPYFIKNAGG